jgi:hypothetical protein
MRLQALARDGHELEPLVVAWYNQKAAPEKVKAPVALPASLQGVDPETMEEVVTLALRPFLERCAEVLQQRLDFAAWSRAYCPICGGALTVQRPLGLRPARLPLLPQRRQVAHHLVRQPRRALPPLRVRCLPAVPEGLRRKTRPVMLVVDTIATLPLDAAAMQRGYNG